MNLLINDKLQHPPNTTLIIILHTIYSDLGINIILVLCICTVLLLAFSISLYVIKLGIMQFSTHNILPVLFVDEK